MGNTKVPSRSWQAIVGETFRRRDDAGALEAKRQIDRGGAPKVSPTAKLHTFADLIDLHVNDMKEIGKRSDGPSLKSCDAWER